MTKKNKAIFFIICSAFCFALMNTFVKLSGDIPSIQKSFFRNLIALFIALLILSKSRIGFGFKKENLKFFLLRSTAGTLGILCNYYAVDRLLLSDASMLGKLAPFFAILFSYFMLKEKISLLQIFSVIAAFIGCLFIIKPGFNLNIRPALIGVVGAMGAGCAYTTVRILSNKGEKGPFIVFFFSAFSCVVTLPYIIFNYHPMSLNQVILLLFAGLAASGGQFAVTAAYANAPAKEISVFDYSQVIFAAFMGFLLFDQIPDLWSILGYLTIILVSVVMFLKNK